MPPPKKTKKLRHDHKPIRNHCSFQCAISDLRPEFQDSIVRVERPFSL